MYSAGFVKVFWGALLHGLRLWGSQVRGRCFGFGVSAKSVPESDRHSFIDWNES